MLQNKPLEKICYEFLTCAMNDTGRLANKTQKQQKTSCFVLRVILKIRDNASLKFGRSFVEPDRVVT
jgi:hypothetical protein